ncbi:Hsp20/alpha crystallin family protein [Bacillus timonensis]|nr:Hsp20/alpha crystallin family protein [Bacillus timonensis]
MNNKENAKPLNFEGIEDWMEQFFEDPFKNYLDEYQFRVDLFETGSEYIIEAELTHFNKEQLSVEVSGDTVIIRANENQKDHLRTINEITPYCYERMITLPFSLLKKKVKAKFTNDILEIIVSKEGKTRRKSRMIPIK